MINIIKSGFSYGIIGSLFKDCEIEIKQLLSAINEVAQGASMGRGKNGI